MKTSVLKIPPSDCFKPFIKYYKYIESDLKGKFKAITTPDIELYFNFMRTDLFMVNCTLINPKIIIAGLQDLYKDNYCCMYGSESQEKAGFVIVFEVMGFYSLFGVKVSEFADYVIHGYNIFGADMNNLWEQLRLFSNPYEMKSLVERSLGKYLNNVMERDYLISHIFDLMSLNHGMIRTSHICSCFNITPRKLQRYIKEQTGFTCKEILQSYRFNYVLNNLNRLTQSNLTKLSYLSGYYDQSHFIKDFKRVTGQTPGLFASNGKKVIEFVDNRKFIQDEQ